MQLDWYNKELKQKKAKLQKLREKLSKNKLNTDLLYELPINNFSYLIS